MAQLGIFVNSPAMNPEDPSRIMDFWRGYLQEHNLKVLPPDGTIRCKDRLREGDSCDDPQVTTLILNSSPY